MISTDTLRFLIDKANATPGSIRDKEAAFCYYITEKIQAHHGDDGLRKAWFCAQHESYGQVAGTPLEKWAHTLSEYMSAFWGQVEAGNITGSLPGASIPQNGSHFSFFKDA